MQHQPADPSIIVRGDVPDAMIAYGNEKLAAVVAHAAVPVLQSELRLDHHTDPARRGANHVEMTIDLDGTPVRARRSADTIAEAIDGAALRLRRRVEAANERPQARELRHRDRTSWHHADRPAQRPHYYPRAVEERSLVRRKTFAMRPESIEEALFDLETLDHDFFLFVHNETNAEAVVYRVGSGYGLMQCVATPEAIKRSEVDLDLEPGPATTTLDEALHVLNETDAPFEFFIERASERGMVAYRRYDGDYGLILPT